MDYIQLMMKKEMFLVSFVNFISDCANVFKFKENRIAEKNKKLLKKNRVSDRAGIILNAPSVNQQDLSLMSGLDLAFVNRGYKHPMFKSLSPKYYIICDPKFKDGIWPDSWVDEIISMVPTISILLPVEWHNEPKLQDLIRRCHNIRWIRIKDKAYSPFVAGYSLQVLADLGYKYIYITGCEANGVGHELVKKQSHFYGVNSENVDKSTKGFAKDFYQYMTNYLYFNSFAKKLSAKGIKVVNLTIGGVLDMFERKKIEEI